MRWTTKFVSTTAEEEFLELPVDIQARLTRIVELIEEHGLADVGKPHVAPIRDKMWELRAKGRDGIGRSLYVAATGRTILILRSFVKKTQKTPKREIDLALVRLREHRHG